MEAEAKVLMEKDRKNKGGISITDSKSLDAIQVDKLTGE